MEEYNTKGHTLSDQRFEHIRFQTVWGTSREILKKFFWNFGNGKNSICGQSGDKNKFNWNNNICDQPQDKIIKMFCTYSIWLFVLVTTLV